MPNSAEEMEQATINRFRAAGHFGAGVTLDKAACLGLAKLFEGVREMRQMEERRELRAWSRRQIRSAIWDSFVTLCNIYTVALVLSYVL
jgi:hypothetical protein